MSRLFLIFFLLFPLGASAKPIIADLNDYHISIDSSFTGGELLMFGAQNDPGNIIVVIRGPERDYVIRKKERKFGVWVNSDQVTFQNVPAYYALTGTKALTDISDSRLYGLLNLGLEQIELTSPKPLAPDTQREFAQAFLQSQLASGLYRDFDEPLSFMGATLFKTPIEFPDTLPRGEYSAELYLVEDGLLRASQTLPIEVQKTGFDAFVYDLAQRTPLLYGLISVLFAVIIGWSVSYFFGRILP